MGKKSIDAERVLIFYPHNFLETSSGTHRRILELLEYFKARDLRVDILSINGFTNLWNEKDLKRTDLFENAHIVEPRRTLKDAIRSHWRARYRRLPDLAAKYLCRRFREVSSQRSYSHILISYVYWGKLIRHAEYDASSIIDLHDFVTLNQYMRSREEAFQLGRMFQEEVGVINNFDYAFSISEEEKLVLEPFCPHTKFVNVPASFPANFQTPDTFQYDLLFVGSGDNPFNRQGIIWFLDEVYPLLNSIPRLAIVGSVCDFFQERQGITLIRHADNLDEIYHQVRVVICPLLGGTGLKVKLVEALSHGKPVVTTRWGLSGIIHKSDNGCLLAKNRKAFADAIERLLTDQEFYQGVRARGTEFFRKTFDREVCWKNLDSVFFRV